MFIKCHVLITGTQEGNFSLSVRMADASVSQQYRDNIITTGPSVATQVIICKQENQ